jgi:hypothetical protein
MSSLVSNDLALIVNKRTIRNLAISRDHQFEQSVNEGVVLLDIAAFISPEVQEWLDRGLEHPNEQTANVQLVVPRLLYATSNNLFGAIPGSTDLEQLLNRIKRYDQIAPGPVAATLPANAEINGVPLDNPCPIVFKEDPNQRFTFLRTQFFHNNPTTFLEVVNNGLLMTIQGKAYRGDLFSRNRAEKSSTHDFTMVLRYEVEFLNNSDLNLGPVPFVMVADPPAPVEAGLPPLPAKDKFVFARQISGNDTGFFLPALVPSPDDPAVLVQPRNVVGALFQGQLDDQLFERADGEPVYRVEPRSDSEPQRYVIRKIDDPSKTILAEARAGRMVLRFKEMVSLTMTPDDVSPADKTAIGNSLCKIHPTLVQGFVCDDIQGDTAVPLAMLSLLGPTSLDIPVMPRSVVVPADAVVVTVENGKPGPLNSVWSDVSTCDLDTDIYFADPDDNKQAFGVTGTIDPATMGGAFADFSAGADFAAGISQRFMQPMLNRAGENIKQSVIEEAPEGLDPASVQFHAFIGEDVLRVTITGQGEIETPWPLPNIGYDFTAKIRLRFRVQKDVVVDGDGAPRDRFNCLIPQEALDAFGLDVAHGRLELPNSISSSAADRNPLSFRGYSDPHQGIACFDNCPATVRLAPPVFDSSVNEIVVDDPDNPPDICGEGQRGDDPQRLGQASFDPGLNPDLRHDWVMVPIPPDDDDDVEVEVDVGIWGMFLFILAAGLTAGMLLPLVPFALPLLPVVMIVLLTGLFLLPFTSMIASSIVTEMVREDMADRRLPSFNLELTPTSFLSLHLENPDVRKPFDWETFLLPNLDGAFITRYHVLIQGAGPNEGT